MRTVTYPGGRTIEYDEEAPCVSCGEPVLAASMGGTALCPSCDLGTCRYCHCRIDCMFDKEERRNHMKFHKEHTPDLVKKVNDGMRRFNALWDKRKKERENNDTNNKH